MNNSIPDIIEKMGIKTFFMDMLPENQGEVSKADDLIKTMQWKFASKILHAADLVVKTENCYPVLITSFKCTPDSFVIEYFKEIFNASQKPYLILQLDEHDSSVGYETRIEAAIRAFRNHRERENSAGLEKKHSEEQLKTKVGPSNTNPSGYQIWSDSIKTLVNEAAQVLLSHSIDFKPVWD